jgi:aminoglycoside phosphotransferase (APT) family kinase protein
VDFGAIADALGGRLAKLSRLGGLANESYRVEVDVAGRIEKFTVKLYMVNDSKLKAERELTVFKLMPEYGLRAPRLALVDLEGRLAGRPLLAWRWIDGVPAEKLLGNPRTRRAAARAMGAALSRLHSIRPSALEARLFKGGEGFWSEEVASIRLLARLHPTCARGFSGLLGELSDLSAERVTLVHGDYNPGNVLMGEGGVYVLDLEGARLGDPLYDVAYACTFVLFEAGVEAAETFAVERFKLSSPRSRGLARRLVAAAAKLYLLLCCSGTGSLLRERAGPLYPLAKALFLEPFKRRLKATALERAVRVGRR